MYGSGFSGKTVVITGASSGIGLAMCRRFFREGATIAAIDIRQDTEKLLLSEINEDRGRVSTYQVDVSSPDEVLTAIDRIVSRYGGVDVLINNAGITCRASFIETTVDEWRRVIDVNLTAVFLMCKAVIPHMRDKGSGAIVNTASGWGLVGGKDAVSYCASKGGVVLLTKAMAIDHGPDNIRVNCICPGDTETDMLVNEARQLGQADDYLINMAHERPLGRVGKPAEIAAAALYLASDEASFVTGEALVVDGGGLAGSA